MAGNFYVPLPKPEIRNAMLDMSGINSAIDDYSTQKRQNAMLEYQHGRDAKTDARAASAESRAQTQFDDKRGEDALNQLAGVYQTINEAPEAERAAMFERVRPLYSKLRTRIPDFDSDLQSMQIDPNDHVAVGKLLMGRARGYSGSTNQFGKTGAVFQGKDGQFYTAQFGENGERRILPLEDGMAPARGTYVVGDEVTNKATGAPVRNVAPALAGAEAAKAEGDVQGKAKANLSTVENAAARMNEQIDKVLTSPGLDRVTGTVYGRLPSVTNTSEPAKEAQSRIDQVAGGVFLQAYNDLRGAGQISNAEGQSAKAAYARLLSQELGAPAYRDALIEFKNEIGKLVEIARAKAGGGAAAPASGGFKYLGPAP